jgi:outer membrane protein TolC
MSRWKILALAGLMATAAQGAFAEADVLQPDALVAAVLERNSGVSAQRAALRAARSRVEPAGSLDDPMLTVAVAPATFDDRDLGPRGQLHVSQALPWPGTLDARRAEAEARADIEDAGLAGLELRLREAALSAFADWYQVHRELSVNARHQDILEELRAVARTRYAAGRASQRDVLAADTELARLEEQALALESRRDAVRSRINALLNQPPATPVAGPDEPDAATPVPDLDALIENAVGGHPELRRLAYRERAAGARVTLSEKAFYPEFRLNAGYNGAMDPAAKRPIVGVTVNLPLDRGRRRAEKDAAEAERLRAQWELEDRRSALVNDLAAVHAAVSRARESVELHDERLLPLAKDSLESALSDYSGGRGAFLDVLDAERARLSAELGLARARASHLKRRAELERLAGLSPADAPAAPASASQYGSDRQ